MPSLPPLTTLLAFESVARRRSFTLAAAEMNLTASAVSHQIARLEQFLGTRLFDRGPHGVRLSADGEAYLQRVAGAIGAIGSATEDLRQGVRHSLYVHASPSFASLWLMPRLADFANAHPDVSLFLSASPSHSNFALGQTDLDIRYGIPAWPDLVVQPIFRERILPLASPALVARHCPQVPTDLLRMPLIQSTVGIIQWTDWLAARDVRPAPERYALRFDRAQLALDAAVQGLGVALESNRIAAPHIEEGRLVPVFDPQWSIGIEGHFIVYPARHKRRPEVESFIDWLGVQARDCRDPLALVPSY